MTSLEDPLEELRKRALRKRAGLQTEDGRPQALKVAHALLGQQKGMTSLARHRDCWISIYCPDCNGVVAAVLHTTVGELWISRADVLRPGDPQHHAVWLDDERLSITGTPHAKCAACNVVRYRSRPSLGLALQELLEEAYFARLRGRRRRLPAEDGLGVSEVEKSMPSG